MAPSRRGLLGQAVVPVALIPTHADPTPAGRWSASSWRTRGQRRRLNIDSARPTGGRLDPGPGRLRRYVPAQLNRTAFAPAAQPKAVTPGRALPPLILPVTLDTARDEDSKQHDGEPALSACERRPIDAGWSSSWRTRRPSRSDCDAASISAILSRKIRVEPRS